MYPYDFIAVSSLEKVLPKENSLGISPIYKLSGLLGERVSFQVAYRYNKEYSLSQVHQQGSKNPSVKIQVNKELADETVVRKVRNVPVMTPYKDGLDDDYLALEAGMYPDILEEFDGWFQCIPYQWRSLWVDFYIPNNCVEEEIILSLDFTDDAENQIGSLTMPIKVIPHKLPELNIVHTEWLHTDCLADYYGCRPFSEEHWTVMENFISLAVERNVNTVLVPLFTLALDTLIGEERTTTQLIGVQVNPEGSYVFDFDNLKRFIIMCKVIGITWFEMSHLFSQWGAKYPCKVVALVQGKEEIIFGWQQTVIESTYEEFLSQLLPKLIVVLEELGVAENTIFHISDEPNKDNMDTYLVAKNMVVPHIEGFKIVDALSDIEIYKEGVVENPVPTNDSIHTFLEAGVKDLWVYYCCDQTTRVANRFVAMPAYRNRILGVQLYLYQLSGFLHWGYNFYNSQYSIKKIDPYQVNDGEDTFPAGDPFIVYPGKDGTPVESMRLPVLSDAMDDYRAFTLLEKLSSREFVVSLIRQETGREITFKDYPRNTSYLPTLREKINREIANRIRD